jgi:farnesyl-diphosphate farnesyltransferase
MTESQGTVWTGEGMTQDDFMKKDQCILCDENDKIVGNCSKYEAHVFDTKNVRGKLHRAFSVFLFNSEGKLLLQQRAESKVTFPRVWTNTCCSHPLYGYNPCEVDDDEAIATGTVMGAKNAAIRKLKQELGIENVDITKFKFLTRLHYWAADVVTHGKESPWGEHEVDYILFMQADVKCLPNPDEVMDVKYVSLDELRAQMDPSSGLLWSPWFRIIVENFLPHWWNNLNETLTTNKFVDVKSIHKFDPTEEHMGGGGHAGAWLGKSKSPYAPLVSSAPVGNTGLKQGAYGKVKIHKHSTMEQLFQFNEVMAAMQLKFGNVLKSQIEISNENVAFCDDMLGKVSRSFAAVIRQLPKSLTLDILVFYLALRALDTIEDDMVSFKGEENVKIDHLNNFYRTGLVDKDWRLYGVGEADELVLLENFHKCTSVFLSLPQASQDVIADITKRMGEGMAMFVGKDLGQGTVTIADYDEYCHYVAGLVGEGLSRLFTCSGYESAAVGNVSKTLANTMGLFLQKTNIIRDYLEDYVDGRAFWPQEIWKQYTVSKNGGLGEFADKKNISRSLHCLNHLITNALECVPECLEYLDLLKTDEVFRFCAIPQVMAIATLHDLYNNEQVFSGVVKIRKGMAASLILDTNDVVGVHKWFSTFAKSILSRIPSNDPNAEKTRCICQTIVKLTNKEATVAKRFSLKCTSVYMTAAFPMWLGLNNSTKSPTFSAVALASVYPIFLFISSRFRK